MPPMHPRRLDEQTPQLARTGFRNVTAMASLGRAILAWHEADRGTDLAGVAEALVTIDKRAKRGRDNQADAGHAAQPRDDRVTRGARVQPGIERVNLCRQRRNVTAQRRERRPSSP